MSLWRSVFVWFQDHGWFADFSFAIVIAALSLAGLFGADVAPTERTPGPLAVILLLVTVLPLAWRRIHPLAVLSVIAVASFAFWVLDYAVAFDSGLLLALYAATAHGRDRHITWRTVGVVWVAGVTLTFIGAVFVPDENLPLVAVLFVPVALASAAILGEVVCQRRMSVAQLEQRAVDLEAELETKTKLATLNERTRIAREMHDVVAHGMSVMIVQAEAAKRVVHKDPGQAEAALGHIEATGRESISEMRRMLGVLRSPETDTDLAPQPRLAAYETLVENAAEAGIDVSVTINGDPRELSPGRELAAYRLVQEALTNVVKHAGASAAADLTISYFTDRVEIEVSDNGLGAAATGTQDGTGHGHIGMHERVGVYQGNLTVGPQCGGGYRVHAMLPTEPASSERDLGTTIEGEPTAMANRDI